MTSIDWLTPGSGESQMARSLDSRDGRFHIAPCRSLPAAKPILFKGLQSKWPLSRPACRGGRFIKADGRFIKAGQPQWPFYQQWPLYQGRPNA